VNQSNPSGFRGEALRGGAPGRRLGQSGASCGATGFGEVAGVGGGGGGGFPLGWAPGAACDEGRDEAECGAVDAAAGLLALGRSSLVAETLSADEDAADAEEDADLLRCFSQRSSRRWRSISNRAFCISARRRARTAFVISLKTRSL
jgi:hypothetical protein